MIALEGVDPRMIANNLTPFKPTHPGELLKEEIKYRGLSKRKLAAQMGISYSELRAMLRCKQPVTAEYASLFETLLGIEAGLFMRLQSDYDMQIARKNKSGIHANIRKATEAFMDSLEHHPVPSP
jgi:addiction module HigA family antidote